jgi:hypothetical protein
MELRSAKKQRVNHNEIKANFDFEKNNRKQKRENLHDL